MNNDLYGGRYTEEEVNRIMEINPRPHQIRKPMEPYFRKATNEAEPSWADKRAFIHFLIHDSTISPTSKVYLQEQEFWIQKYQLRGFKYGLFASTLTFFCMPVVRRQPFVTRFLVTCIPMAWFLKFGHTWGH